MSKMTPLHGSNDPTKGIKLCWRNHNNAPKGVKLHSMSQIALLVGLFNQLKWVILDIGNCTQKGGIWLPFSVQWYYNTIICKDTYIP